MEIIIRDKNGANRYRIRPYHNNLCWQLEEWRRPKPDKPFAWYSLDKYQATLSGAYFAIYELCAKTEDVEVDSIAGLIYELRAIESSIKAAKEWRFDNARGGTK